MFQKGEAKHVKQDEKLEHSLFQELF
jgi:hypothetical protein